ncbi:MAG TPA: universal stress protein [Ktedonobacterales bacterium]|nr:universal stress protein [Ktedonobacterales bacterium]
MFRRILIPWDTSPNASAAQYDALHLARTLATRTGAAILLAHVIPVAGESVRDTTERAQVETQAQRLRAEGLDASAVTAHGPIAENILTIAQTHRADMLLLAPQQHGLFEALWRPNVSAQIFSQASLPALITPPASSAQNVGQRSVDLLTESIASVIVPLDGSELAERALPYARVFAEEYHRSLLLTRVVAPIVTWAGPEAAPFMAEAEGENERAALTYLQSVQKRLEQQTTMPIYLLLRVGQPADEIRRVFEEHPGSLLVMSTHGRTGMTRTLLGSVATEVMRHALAPMLIIPPHCPPLASFSFTRATAEVGAIP